MRPILSPLLITFLLSIIGTTVVPTRSLEQVFHQDDSTAGGIDGTQQQASATTTTTTTTTAVREFVMPKDFYVGKCDPCIARADYSIQVITHGTSNSVYWLRIQAAMQQASRDTGIAIRMELNDVMLTQEEIESRMASTIRKYAAQLRQQQQQFPGQNNNNHNNNNKLPNALIVTLPSAQVHQAVQSAVESGFPIFGFQTGYQVAHHVGVLGFVAQDEYKAGQLVAHKLLQLQASQKDEGVVIMANSTTPTAAVTLVPSTNNTTSSSLVDASSSIEAATTTNNSTNQEKYQQQQLRVLFVNHKPADADLIARFQGLQSTLLQASNGTIIVSEILVDLDQVFQTVQALNDEVFLNCPYDMVVLGGDDESSSSLVDIAVSARHDSQCHDKTILAAFGGTSPSVIQAIVQRRLAFVAAPQQYIESMFVVVMASMYVTTGKKLSLPQDSQIYLSGPKIITEHNVPTDTVQTCQEQAFPVCNSATGKPFADYSPTTLAIAAGNSNNNNNNNNNDPGEFPDASTISSVSSGGLDGSSGMTLCNDIGCLPRDTIRIGGVLHGVSTDLFWDPVFAAAKQAANDLGIVLDLERLQPQETTDIVHAKMAARIRNLCESGVDGLFVTIPADEVVEPIKFCLSLNIPVISINAGADKSKEMGLLQHIGQMEYNAGYGAGQRLVGEGGLQFFCLNHAWGNVVLEDRCRGFSDAIAEHPGTVYRGMVRVADDNLEKFKLAVETAVNERSENLVNTWDGVVILLGGANLVEATMQLLSIHTNVIVGSFDLNEVQFEPFQDGRLKFGIDQQPFLQGSLPVFLLAYAAQTQQALINDVVETGPRFVDAKPTPEEEQCETTFFQICSLIPQENFNLISSGLLVVGFVLVGLTVISALICVGYVVYYRTSSQLVRVSQPPFLIALCCGIIISSLSIIPMGAQTEYRYTKDELSTGLLTEQENPDIALVDSACMMVPWLYSLGFSMVFSSLFGKIWRVQMIYKAGASFRRKIVTFMDIAPRVAVMFVIVLALLIVWQVVSPFEWQRDIIASDTEGFTLESIGMCTSDNGWWFWLAILCFQVLCLCYALVLCFQTKHIQDDLSESSSTFLSVVCIFQVNVLAMPISAMVRDDTEVFYFVRACAVFLQNYSVLCLMFLPKMHRTYTGNDELPTLQPSSIRRSSVRVSFDIPTASGDSANFSTPFRVADFNDPDRQIPRQRKGSNAERSVSFLEDEKSSNGLSTAEEARSNDSSRSALDEVRKSTEDYLFAVESGKNSLGSHEDDEPASSNDRSDEATSSGTSAVDSALKVEALKATPSEQLEKAPNSVEPAVASRSEANLGTLSSQTEEDGFLEGAESPDSSCCMESIPEMGTEDNTNGGANTPGDDIESSRSN